MTQMKLVKTIFLKAPRAHVWRFLTEKDKLALWFHAAASDVKPGGELTFLTNAHDKEGERLCWGAVKEMDPPRRLAHTFTHQWIDGVETLCVWELEEYDGGTMLTLTHTGWERLGDKAFAHAADHDRGWDEHFVRLRRVTN